MNYALKKNLRPLHPHRPGSPTPRNRQTCLSQVQASSRNAHLPPDGISSCVSQRPDGPACAVLGPPRAAHQGAVPADPESESVYKSATTRRRSGNKTAGDGNHPVVDNQRASTLTAATRPHSWLYAPPDPYILYVPGSHRNTSNLNVKRPTYPRQSDRQSGDTSDCLLFLSYNQLNRIYRSHIKTFY